MMRIHIGNILRKHDDDVPRTREKKDSVNSIPVDEVMLSLCTLMDVGSTGVWSIGSVSLDAYLHETVIHYQEKSLNHPSGTGRR